jgi:iron-sulfur cluster assembly protein
MSTDVNTFDPQQISQAITLSPAAVEHVKKIIANRGKGIGLRLGVKKAGCTGFSYVVDIADEKTTEDRIFSLDNGLSILVDQQSYPFLQGTHIDYVRKGLNSNFEFHNPNAKAICGCGESFSTSEV